MSEAAEKLHELFASEWDYQLEQYPTWASRLGDRRWNDRWEDRSLDAINKRHSHHIEVLTKLRAHQPREIFRPPDRHELRSFPERLPRTKSTDISIAGTCSL